MVAFEGKDPVAVVHAAKRATQTGILRLAVHPDHQRRGHGRHLLTSLGDKLAILGPPGIVAEVPEENAPARALLEACGYRVEGVLTDWEAPGHALAGATGSLPPGPLADAVVPITVDELVDAGALTDPPVLAWDRAAPALLGTKARSPGLALVSPDRVEAWVVFDSDSTIAGLRCLAPDLAHVYLRLLLDRLLAEAAGPVRIPKASPQEVATALLSDLGFRPGARHLLHGRGEGT